MHTSVFFTNVYDNTLQYIRLTLVCGVYARPPKLTKNTRVPLALWGRILRSVKSEMRTWRQWCQNHGFAPTDPTTTPRPSVPPPSACTAPHKHTRPYIRVPYALPGRRSPARIRFPDIEAPGSQAKSYEFKSRCGYSTFFLYLFSNFSSYILRRLKTWKLLIYKIFSNATICY